MKALYLLLMLVLSAPLCAQTDTDDTDTVHPDTGDTDDSDSGLDDDERIGGGMACAMSVPGHSRISLLSFLAGTAASTGAPRSGYPIRGDGNH